MTLFINNNSRNVPDSVRTIKDLLVFLSLPDEGTGVGLNGRLVPSRNWDSTQLKDEDRLMIVTATYGG